MKVTIADPCGFCAGVKRAVELARNAAPAETLGPIVHNREVVSGLEESGIHPVTSVADVTAKRVVTRAHGTPKDEMNTLEAKAEVIDATCTGVYRLHDAAKRFEQAGYHVLVFGDEDHPETKALMSYLSCATVTREPLHDTSSPLACVAQTTMDPYAFEEFVARVRENCPGAVYEDTICRSTQRRQQAAARLAPQVDLMIVVGGVHSSNTRRLAETCERYCPTLHVEDEDGIEAAALRGCEHIGVTAGASTPPERIDRIYQWAYDVTNK